MSRTRPFIDRRLKLTALFEGSNISSRQATELEHRIVDDFNNVLDLNVFATDASVKAEPPQVTLILNESSVGTNSVRVLDMKLREAINMDSSLPPVQRTDIIAGALSPGDKVRNATPIPRFD